MSLQRIISKSPNVPNLNAECIKLLTKLIFWTDNNLIPADLLLVFGRSSNRDRLVYTKIIYNIVNKDLIPIIILTGGIPRFEGNSIVLDKPESLLLYNTLDLKRCKAVTFILEKTSVSSYDNVNNSLVRYDFNKVRKIIFLSAAFGAGRCYLTIRKLLPHVEILQKTMPTIIDGNEINRENWFKYEESRKRVWSEYLRIINYGDNEIKKAEGVTGLIEFEEVRDLVTEINDLTNNKFIFNTKTQLSDNYLK